MSEYIGNIITSISAVHIPLLFSNLHNLKWSSFHKTHMSTVGNINTPSTSSKNWMLLQRFELHGTYLNNIYLPLKLYEKS